MATEVSIVLKVRWWIHPFIWLCRAILLLGICPSRSWIERVISRGIVPIVK